MLGEELSNLHFVDSEGVLWSAAAPLVMLYNETKDRVDTSPVCTERRVSIYLNLSGSVNYSLMIENDTTMLPLARCVVNIKPRHLTINSPDGRVVLLEFSNSVDLMHWFEDISTLIRAANEREAVLCKQSSSRGSVPSVLSQLVLFPISVILLILEVLVSSFTATLWGSTSVMHSE